MNGPHEKDYYYSLCCENDDIIYKYHRKTRPFRRLFFFFPLYNCLISLYIYIYQCEDVCVSVFLRYIWHTKAVCRMGTGDGGAFPGWILFFASPPRSGGALTSADDKSFTCPVDFLGDPYKPHTIVRFHETFALVRRGHVTPRASIAAPRRAAVVLSFFFVRSGERHRPSPGSKILARRPERTDVAFKRAKPIRFDRTPLPPVG